MSGPWALYWWTLVKNMKKISILYTDSALRQDVAFHAQNEAIHIRPEVATCDKRAHRLSVTWGQRQDDNPEEFSKFSSIFFLSADKKRENKAKKIDIGSWLIKPEIVRKGPYRLRHSLDVWLCTISRKITKWLIASGGHRIASPVDYCHEEGKTAERIKRKQERQAETASPTPRENDSQGRNIPLREIHVGLISLILVVLVIC